MLPVGGVDQLSSGAELEIMQREDAMLSGDFDEQLTRLSLSRHHQLFHRLLKHRPDGDDREPALAGPAVR